MSIQTHTHIQTCTCGENPRWPPGHVTYDLADTILINQYRNVTKYYGRASSCIDDKITKCIPRHLA